MATAQTSPSISRFTCKRDRQNFPDVDQGTVHGLPVTWNPDDSKFYVHKAGTTDGTNVLGMFKSWTNAVQFARRKGRAS